MVRRVAFRALSGTGLTAEYLRRRVPVAASCIGTLSVVAIATIFRLTIYEEESSARFQLPTPPIPGAADLSELNHSPAPEDKLAD